MSTNEREGRFDYIEFPAGSREVLAAAKRFYGEVFGWSFQDWGDEYADTRSSGVSCGFSCTPQDRPSSTLAVLFVGDLEAVKERVVKAGASIARDIISFPGGRRFEYIDPAGNRVGVWSDK